MERIRTALGRVKTINTKATAVRTGADEIQREAELLRDDVRGALSDLEESLRLRASAEPIEAAQQGAAPDDVRGVTIESRSTHT